MIKGDLTGGRKGGEASTSEAGGAVTSDPVFKLESGYVRCPCYMAPQCLLKTLFIIVLGLGRKVGEIHAKTIC